MEARSRLRWPDGEFSSRTAHTSSLLSVTRSYSFPTTTPAYLKHVFRVLRIVQLTTCTSQSRRPEAVPVRVG